MAVLGIFFVFLTIVCNLSTALVNFMLWLQNAQNNLYKKQKIVYAEKNFLFIRSFSTETF